MVPLSAPAVLVQKGVAQEVRGGCSVDAPPTGAWLLSLQGAGLQVASRDCVARSGLRAAPEGHGLPLAPRTRSGSPVVQ